MSKIKFQTTRKEFTLSEEGGYTFKVYLVHDDEYGWDAHVAFQTTGFKDEESALNNLVVSVGRFLEMLKGSKEP